MPKQIVVNLEVTAEAAVRAGKSTHGIVALELDDAFVASLTDAERVELTRQVRADELVPPTRAGKGIVLLGADASVEVLREILRTRAAERAEVEKAKAADEERRALEFLTRVEQPDVAWTQHDTGDYEFNYGDGTLARARYPERYAAALARRTAWQVEVDATKQAEVERVRAQSEAAYLQEAVRHTRDAGHVAADFAGPWVGPYDLGRRDEVSAAVAAHLAALGAKAAAENARLEASRKAALRAVVAEYAPEELPRYDEGFMSEDEALRLARDAVFAPLAKFPRYERMCAADVCEAEHDVAFSVEPALHMSAAAYQALQALRSAMPAGACETRVHSGVCQEDECDMDATRNSAKVTIEWHGWVLSREFAQP